MPISNGQMSQARRVGMPNGKYKEVRQGGWACKTVKDGQFRLTVKDGNSG